MSRIDELKEMMRAFLNEEEEEVPLDYQDIEFIYNELCKEKLTNQEQRFIAHHDNNVKKTLNMTETALNNGWIPVSEGLPETGWYLATFKTADGGYAVCELGFRKPEGYWTDRNITRKSFVSDDVVAWMPKPKPYNPPIAEKTMVLTVE